MAEAHLSKVSEEAWQRIFTLRDNFVEKYGEPCKPYDYQRDASDKIIRSVLEGKGETTTSRTVWPLRWRSWRKGPE